MQMIRIGQIVMILYGTGLEVYERYVKSSGNSPIQNMLVPLSLQYQNMLVLQFKEFVDY